MSPTPTPTIDSAPIEQPHVERITQALEHLSETSTADLDSLLDGGGNPFLAPFRALPLRFEFGTDSVTITTAPYLIPTLLIGAVLTALVVFIHSRVTSPEARTRMASKRAATHALYTNLIHDKRERAMTARIEERRARDDAPSDTP